MLVPAHELPAGVLIVAEPPVKVGKSVIVDDSPDVVVIRVESPLAVVVVPSVAVELSPPLDVETSVPVADGVHASPS